MRVDKSVTSLTRNDLTLIRPDHLFAIHPCVRPSFPQRCRGQHQRLPQPRRSWSGPGTKGPQARTSDPSLPVKERTSPTSTLCTYLSMDSEGAISSTGDVPNFFASKKKLDLQSGGSAGHWRPIRVQHIKNRSQSSRVEWQTIVQQINTFYPARNADLKLCNATAYFRPSCMRT